MKKERNSNRLKPIDFLRSREFDIEFRWIDKYTFAQIDWEKEKIYINSALMHAACYVHEFLHYRHPKKRHSKIYIMEKRRLDRMSRREIEELGNEMELFRYSQPIPETG